jgi:catechol 2,3-dioxygenase-like lactoylglutathione lyase family enzyme
MDDSAVLIKRVSHVSINVSDLERSVAFYKDVFGWEQIFDSEVDSEALSALVGVPGATGQACGGRIGDLRVELMCLSYTPKTPPAPGLGLQVLSFEVEDIQAAHDAFQARGVPVMGPLVELHGTKMFFVSDPDGQGIEICEYIPGASGWDKEHR